MKNNIEEKIKQTLKITESIIIDSGINEQFKQVAFREVFRILFVTEENQNYRLLSKNPGNIKKEAVMNVKTPSKSRSSRAKLVDELIKNNFFIEKRRDIDCINEINLSKGIKIPRNQMATILVRKLRSGSLRREKANEGYVYFNVN